MAEEGAGVNRGALDQSRGAASFKPMLLRALLLTLALSTPALAQGEFVGMAGPCGLSP